MDYNTTFANYQSEVEKNRLTKQAENEAYLKSQAWKDQLEKARQAKPQSYSCVFKDTDGELKEAWHFLSEDNIEHVKNKYVQDKKEIVYFAPMDSREFGQVLQEIKRLQAMTEKDHQEWTKLIAELNKDKPSLMDLVNRQIEDYEKEKMK